MRLEPFKAIDWFLVDSIEEIEIPYERAMLLEKKSIAFSAFDNIGCMGCAGMLFWSETEAEVWLRLDKRVIQTPRGVIRAIKEGFKILLPYSSGRVFAWVDEELPIAQRFIEWMGFIPSEKTKILYGKNIRLWELNNADSNDRWTGNKCGRGNPAGTNS